MRRVARAAAPFGLASFFSDLCHETVSTALPVFITGIGAPPAAIGVVEGAADAASAFAKILGGRVADRARRLKGAAVAGYAVTGVAVPLIGLATSWVHVLLLRTVGWFGRGFRSPVRDELLSRRVPPGARGAAFGIERAMDQTGALLAPLIVLALVQGGWGVSEIMLAAVVPGAAAAVALALGVRERPAAGTVATPDASQADAAPDDGAPWPPAFRRLTLAVAAFGVGDFSKLMVVTWAIGGAATSEGPLAGTLTTSALLYGGYNLVTAPTAWLAGAASDRYGRKPLLFGGYVCGVLGALVVAASAPGVAPACIALALFGLLAGSQEVVERAWAADLAPGGKRGRAFGRVHMVNGVANLVASGGVAALWKAFGPATAFASAAAAMAFGAAMTLTVPGRTPSRTPLR
ncbi:MAG TPA: MFS transporter [Planctomycetota bacterium]|nr:MFS transporter [Planctomycetota bacterium]